MQEGIHDQFVAALASKMSSELIIGNGMDEKTTVGPLINDRAVEKVQTHVEDAISKGAKLIQGGKKLTGKNNCYFYEPTLITGATDKMIIAKEETFGPVAAIFKYVTK